MLHPCGGTILWKFAQNNEPKKVWWKQRLGWLLNAINASPDASGRFQLKSVLNVWNTLYSSLYSSGVSRPTYVEICFPFVLSKSVSRLGHEYGDQSFTYVTIGVCESERQKIIGQRNHPPSKKEKMQRCRHPCMHLSLSWLRYLACICSSQPCTKQWTLSDCTDKTTCSASQLSHCSCMFVHVCP